MIEDIKSGNGLSFALGKLRELCKLLPEDGEVLVTVVHIYMYFNVFLFFFVKIVKIQLQKYQCLKCFYLLSYAIKMCLAIFSYCNFKDFYSKCCSG